jgi:hypothetical protein
MLAQSAMLKVDAEFATATGSKPLTPSEELTTLLAGK